MSQVPVLFPVTAVPEQVAGDVTQLQGQALRAEGSLEQR